MYLIVKKLHCIPETNTVHQLYFDKKISGWGHRWKTNRRVISCINHIFTISVALYSCLIFQVSFLHHVPWRASCSNYFRAMVYEKFCFIWESLCFHSWRIFSLNTEFWFCSHFLLALEIYCSIFLAPWFLMRNMQLFQFLFIYK